MKNDFVPAWLDQVGFFSIDLGLDRMRELLSRLGNPEKNLRFIHVAGSNGKGSVCVFTESALLNSGYRVGFYSSPHLVTLAERFRINGKNVAGTELAAALEIVRPAVETMRRKNNGPTYFEITTAVALVLFQRAGVDFAVWETGLGGRLDATNVIVPELSVITGISLEHTQYLGNTLGAIAAEKAGIIKENVPVICGPLPEEAECVIREKSRDLHAPLTVIQTENLISRISHQPDGHILQEIELAGVPLKTKMIGFYQRDNIAVAAETVRQLSDKFGFDLKKALKGFESAEWPARLQVVPEKRLIIDGAHNPGGAEALAKSLRLIFPETKLHFISGAFSDKDAHGVLKEFVPLAADFLFVPFSGAGRQVRSPEELGEVLKDLAPMVKWRGDSLENALNELPQSGWTVLTGSLHLCGFALELLDLVPR